MSKDIEKETAINSSLDSFKKASEQMVATSDRAYDDVLSNYTRRFYRSYKEYTDEDIANIIEDGSIDEQARLSRHFYNKNGFYKRIILHYTTFLKNIGVVIPNVKANKAIDESYIAKKYYQAVDYVEKMNIPDLLTRISNKVLVNGTYYGVVQTDEGKVFSVIDLPFYWCRSRFKDQSGNDVIEFNVAYFDSITNAKKRKSALDGYPKEISSYYRKWIKNREKTRWLFISSDIGICFKFFDGRPLFIHVIPTTLEYDAAIQRNNEREIEEIKNILVQQIPSKIGDDGDSHYLFEFDEASTMHEAAVGMLSKNNPNTAVLTTYAEVDTLNSKTTGDASTRNSIETMKENIYGEAGVSNQIFAASSNSAIDTSLKNDLALMMILGNKYSIFVTTVLNKEYSNGNISFKYTILPISWYNSSEYIKETLDLARSGYSFILPALGSGISQRDLIDLKELENTLLVLEETLIPLRSSYTQTDNAEVTTETTGGRTELPAEQKAQKTIENINSGGSTNG